MKPTELRIGNYVFGITDTYVDREDKIDVNVFKVALLAEDVVKLDIGFGALEGYEEKPIISRRLHELKPIPLTEEWLLKFENVSINIHGEVIVYNENSNGFEIVIFEFKHGNLYYTAGEGAKLSPPIEFLHQFQNYVYLLSGGNELKLKK